MSGKQDFVQLNITHIVKEDLLIFSIVIYLHPLQLTYTWTISHCLHAHTYSLFINLDILMKLN